MKDGSAAPGADAARHWWGAASIFFFVIHGAVLVWRNESPHLLWSCHVAAVLVGAGLLFRVPLLNAIGTVWLPYGDSLWILHLCGGAEFYPTSVLTHIGSLAVGCAGVRMLGIPRHTWIWALCLLAILQGVTRLATHGGPNINLAFRVWEGWDRIFASYPAYLAFLYASTAVVFCGTEKALRSFLAR